MKNAQSAPGVDWASYYDNLEKKGNIPDASCSVIEANASIFRGMALNLSDIKNEISEKGISPILITVYADVLMIPSGINWALQSQGLLIYARLIIMGEGATIILDYQKDSTAKLILFGNEIQGILTAKAAFSPTSPPQLFLIGQDTISPGILIKAKNKVASLDTLSLENGIAFNPPYDMELYLNNSFIFGSLLYDQNPELAVALFLWVKGWAAQSPELNALFYRSTSLATLLNSQLNSQKNGAQFVPYLTSAVYTKLAGAFAESAEKYENDYRLLSTQEVLTEQNIAMAKTMVSNTESEITYIKALLEQANENYNNAEKASQKALQNFYAQQTAVAMVAIDFREVGIPAYQRKVILEGILDLVKAVVTFGTAIASMAVGNEAAAPAAAAGAIKGAEAVANAAKTGAEVAKMATDLSKTMEKLKKLVEVLKKVFELAKSVKDVADNIGSAQSKTKIIQEMKDTTDGADLSAADGWAVYKIQTDIIMANPIELEIEYSQDYKEAMDILVVYGQSLSAVQLALIRTGQEVASLIFQLHYAQEKEKNLKNLVEQLEVGGKTNLNMMQLLYQKYVDSKSSLFSALKSYQASFFYWALNSSSINPKIIDPVSDLNSGIEDITALAMDEATALKRFNPPPQLMKNMTFVIEDEANLDELKENLETNWVIPLGEDEFMGLDRIRLDDLRIWIEGIQFLGKKTSVYVTVTNSGNYLDRYEALDYQFNSKPLTRTFEYKVSNDSKNSDWAFENGTFGLVQIDGAVDHEVSYAYFRPTPFSEWKISLRSNNSDLDLSKVSKITMYMEGTAIGATTLGFAKLHPAV